VVGAGAVACGAAPRGGRPTRPVLRAARWACGRRRRAAARSSGCPLRTALAAALHGPGGLVAQLALVDPLLGLPGGVAPGAAVVVTGAVRAPSPRRRPPGVRRGGRRDLGGAPAGEPAPAPRSRHRAAAATGGRPAPVGGFSVPSPGAQLWPPGRGSLRADLAATLPPPAGAAGAGTHAAGAGTRAAGARARATRPRGTLVATTTPALATLTGGVARAGRPARPRRVARPGRPALAPATRRAAILRLGVPIPPRTRRPTLLARWPRAAPQVRLSPSRPTRPPRPAACAACGGLAAGTAPTTPPVVGVAAATGARRCHVEPGYRRPHEHLCEAKREEGRPEGRPSSREIRRRPTLPGSLLPSTIGAGGLNFRVRNGNGCDPSAMATEICCQLRSVATERRPPEDSIASTNITEIQALGRLVPVGCTRCRASTSGLSTWWSTTGLTRLTLWGTSSWNGLRT
jgi:hypothetical protein